MDNTVANIHIKVIKTNAWDDFSRRREWSCTWDWFVMYELTCPMSKCLGDVRGIDYKPTLSDMIKKKESKRTVELNCRGYDGYNLKSHCEWYVVLEIEITYSA